MSAALAGSDSPRSRDPGPQRIVDADPPRIVGIDFSSAPQPRKPIIVAIGGALAPSAGGSAVLRIETFVQLPTLAAFETWLAADACWIAGCDFPFGLPRDFVDAQGWSALGYRDVIARTAALSRSELVARCRDYAAARPVGQRFAHRATDRPAGSSPSMKWVNPPVVLMLHAGVPRLLGAGITLPGLCCGDPRRVALEAYPGLLARAAIGRRSYKSDDRRCDDADRRAARTEILAKAAAGAATGVRMRLSSAVARECIDDFRGDALDAVLCAAQAAWGALRCESGWGLPATVDPIEGWIVGAGCIAGSSAATVVPPSMDDRQGSMTASNRQP